MHADLNIGSKINFKVKSFYTTRYQLVEDRIKFVEMRDTINEMDSLLSYILSLRIGLTIFSVMLDIYVVAIFTKIPQMKEFAKMMSFTAIALVLELVISCSICGAVHESSDQIYAILDSFNGNDLSDFEFKEWLMFKTTSKKTKFGFTIGDFASMKKTTLISVKQNSNHGNINLIIFIPIDVYIYTQLYCNSITNHTNIFN